MRKELIIATARLLNLVDIHFYFDRVMQLTQRLLRESKAEKCSCHKFSKCV